MCIAGPVVDPRRHWVAEASYITSTSTKVPKVYRQCLTIIASFLQAMLHEMISNATIRLRLQLTHATWAPSFFTYLQNLAMPKGKRLRGPVYMTPD